MIQTLAELDRVREECRRMVTGRALAAAAAGAVPLPGVDLLADVGLLANLLRAISARFGLAEEQVRKMDPGRAERALAAAAALGNNVIGRAVTRRIAAALLKRVGARLAAGSAAKLVPVVGSAVSAAVGFGALKLAGDAHVEDCYRTARALLADG